MATSHIFLTISAEDYDYIISECELFNVSFEERINLIVSSYCDMSRLEDEIVYENDPRRSL